MSRFLPDEFWIFQQTAYAHKASHGFKLPRRPLHDNTRRVHQNAAHGNFEIAGEDGPLYAWFDDDTVGQESGSFTFTNCNASGQYGPTVSTCNPIMIPFMGQGSISGGPVICRREVLFLMWIPLDINCGPCPKQVIII